MKSNDDEGNCYCVTCRANRFKVTMGHNFDMGEKAKMAMLMTRKEAEAKLEAANVPRNMNGAYFLLDTLKVLGLIEFKTEEPATKVLFTYKEKDGKITRLELWPEGLVLWSGGVLQWKEWVV